MLPRRKLAHQQSLFGDPADQRGVAPRVGHVHPAGQDTDRRTADRQRAPVGGRVDPVGAAGHDHPAALGELCGEITGDVRTVRRAGPGPDHRDRSQGEQAQRPRPEHPEPGGPTLPEVVQLARPLGVARNDEAPADRAHPLQIGDRIEVDRPGPEGRQSGAVHAQLLGRGVAPDRPYDVQCVEAGEPAAERGVPRFAEPAERSPGEALRLGPGPGLRPRLGDGCRIGGRVLREVVRGETHVPLPSGFSGFSGFSVGVGLGGRRADRERVGRRPARASGDS